MSLICNLPLPLLLIFTAPALRGSTLAPVNSHPFINPKEYQHLLLHSPVIPSHAFDDILYLFVFLLLCPVFFSCFRIAFPFYLASRIFIIISHARSVQCIQVFYIDFEKYPLCNEWWYNSGEYGINNPCGLTRTLETCIAFRGTPAYRFRVLAIVKSCWI